jgi:hypothetical protein
MLLKAIAFGNSQKLIGGAKQQKLHEVNTHLRDAEAAFGNTARRTELSSQIITGI